MCTYMYDAEHSDCQIKFCQYQMRAVSPNLLLAKVIRYTVVHTSVLCKSLLHNSCHRHNDFVISPLIVGMP